MRILQALTLLGGVAASLRCATLAADAGDIDAVRPNAHAGPFRPLKAGELANGVGVAPYPLSSDSRRFRSPSVVDLAQSGAPGATALYALADQEGTSGVYRFLGPDARSFGKLSEPSEPVLSATDAWEGAAIEDPSAHRVGDEIWLVYAGSEGIGLARSSDGIHFDKAPGPVLDASGAPPWEGDDAPRAPCLLVLGEADLRLFYAAGGRIGEARSSDGVSWQRLADGPVLEPAGGPGFDAGGVFDQTAVGDPWALAATTAEGRRLTRVYYAGSASDGRAGIGLAARFADEGPLERAVGPVFPADLDARSPSVLAFASLTLLYVSELAGTGDNEAFPAIAVGVAPATLAIPAD